MTDSFLTDTQELKNFYGNACSSEQHVSKHFAIRDDMLHVIIIKNLFCQTEEEAAS